MEMSEVVQVVQGEGRGGRGWQPVWYVSTFVLGRAGVVRQPAACVATDQRTPLGTGL